jgi:hypothetical protein
MIEPVTVHVTRMSSVCSFVIFQIGPLWAVAECDPEGAYKTYFRNSEWADAVALYNDLWKKRRYDEAIWKLQDEHYYKTKEILHAEELESLYGKVEI